MTLAIADVGTAAPWRDPQLTSLHRLPMHTLRHDDPAPRIELDGRGASSSSARRTPSPAPDWAEADVPGCWTMQGFDDLPHYTNVQMPFPGLPPDIPDDNPTGVYEREIEVAGRLARAAGSCSTSARPRAS